MLKNFLKICSYIILVFILIIWAFLMFNCDGILSKVFFTVISLIIGKPFCKCFLGVSKKAKIGAYNTSEIKTNSQNKDTKMDYHQTYSNNKINSKYIFAKIAKRKEIIIVVCLVLVFFFAINSIAKVNGQIKSVEITNMIPSDNKFGGTKIFFDLKDNGIKDFIFSKDIEIYKKEDWERLSDKDKQDIVSNNKKYTSGNIVYNNDGYSVDTSLKNEGDYVLAIRGYKYDTRKLGASLGMIFSTLNISDQYYYVTYNFNLSKDFVAKIKQDDLDKGSQKNDGFTMTINHLDPIIDLIDELYNEFNNSENWYNGNPVIESNKTTETLNALEDADTTPLQDIVAMRKEYDLAEKLADVSININEIKSNLINMMRRSYFPPEKSDWKGDIQKAKKLLDQAEGYAKTYRSIKSEIKKGNIH